ncbi:Pr6Pr family membrane protein [Roseateles cavernae]|uniref:Pr6Pr family membrane protein n=1 Tax=Roseateles cavernae TaxID=3153578 RepID=UPI0032E518FC
MQAPSRKPDLSPTKPLLRLGLALLTLGAIAWQLRIHLSLGMDPVNFFSYFTNLSNLLAASMLLVLALDELLNSSRLAARPGWQGLRARSIANMLVVGLVFAVLLRNVDLGALLPWINFVLHTLMPCALLLDWWLRPPAADHGLAVSARSLGLTLLFPALYLIYVMLRGSATGWYPYPFLRPDQAGGGLAVSAYALGIAVSFVVAHLFLRAVAGWRLRLSSSPPPDRSQ